MHFETNKAINLIMKSSEVEGNKVSMRWWGMDEHFTCAAAVKLNSINIFFQRETVLEDMIFLLNPRGDSWDKNQSPPAWYSKA